jgi:uncharacterized protein
MKAKYFLPILCVCLTAVSVLHAEKTIPKLEQRVTDLTNTLSFQEWQALEKMVKSYEDTTSNQIAILMIQTLDGWSIEEYANKVFTENRIGAEKKNNGVLLVVAKNEQTMKIEVGYGLEGVLTDALASRIIRDEIVPSFRQGNYFAGLISGTDAAMRACAGEYHADEKSGRRHGVPGNLVLLIIVFILFFLTPLFPSRRRHIIGSGGPFYYSGWGGGFGSGLGGGSGGGWSGGGGGMSGGGGAVGSW